MPRPTSGTTIQRADLGMLAYEYLLSASQRGFIGSKLMPFVGVSEQSGDYPIIPIESLLKMPDVSRTAGGNYNRSPYSFDNDTYACKEKGWEELLDDSEARLYSRFFDAEEIAMQRAIDILLRNYEKQVADLLMSTATITGTSNVTTEWSTITAKPRADIVAAKIAMRAAGGLKPNAIAFSQKVWDNLLKVTEILERFQYTSPIEKEGVEAQKRIIAQYFDVDEIFVGDAIYDTAKKGQTFSISDIWNDEYVLLANVLKGKNLKQPVVGATFLWEKDSPSEIVIEQYREEKKRSNVYRVRNYIDTEIIFSRAGYLLGNITA